MAEKFIIEQPCPVKWTSMTKEEQGKYCSLCNKTVVDFTNKKEDQILAYLQQNNGKKICGYFKAEQIISKRSFLEKMLIEFKMWADTRLSIRLAKVTLTFVAGVLMFLTGCKSRTTGEVSVENNSMDTTCQKSQKSDFRNNQEGRSSDSTHSVK